MRKNKPKLSKKTISIKPEVWVWNDNMQQHDYWGGGGDGKIGYLCLECHGFARKDKNVKHKLNCKTAKNMNSQLPPCKEGEHLITECPCKNEYHSHYEDTYCVKCKRNIHYYVENDGKIECVMPPVYNPEKVVKQPGICREDRPKAPEKSVAQQRNKCFPSRPKKKNASFVTLKK